MIGCVVYGLDGVDFLSLFVAGGCLSVLVVYGGYGGGVFCLFVLFRCVDLLVSVVLALCMVTH